MLFLNPRSLGLVQLFLCVFCHLSFSKPITVPECRQRIKEYVRNNSDFAKWKNKLHFLDDISPTLTSKDLEIAQDIQTIIRPLPSSNILSRQCANLFLHASESFKMSRFFGVNIVEKGMSDITDVIDAYLCKTKIAVFDLDDTILTEGSPIRNSPSYWSHLKSKGFQSIGLTARPAVFYSRDEFNFHPSMIDFYQTVLEECHESVSAHKEYTLDKSRIRHALETREQLTSAQTTFDFFKMEDEYFRIDSKTSRLEPIPQDEKSLTVVNCDELSTLVAYSDGVFSNSTQNKGETLKAILNSFSYLPSKATEPTCVFFTDDLADNIDDVKQALKKASVRLFTLHIDHERKGDYTQLDALEVSPLPIPKRPPSRSIVNSSSRSGTPAYTFKNKIGCLNFCTIL